MPTGDQPPSSAADDVVLTREGALPREVFEARQAAETAGEVVPVAELLEQRRKELVAETADAPVQTFVERGVGAATFGLFDLAAGEEERLERARRVEASPRAALAGEISGAVIPGILSGGTGVVGSLARLTPAGRAAAISARMASGGRTAAAKFARGVGAGAIEAAAEGLGNTLSRQALSENPDFSAEALLSGAGRGALFGGVIGGGAAAVGAVGRRIAKARRAAGEAADTVTPLQRLADAETAAAAKAAPAQVDIGALVTRNGREATPEAFSSLVGRIDDSVAKATGKDIDKLLSKPGVVLADAERARLNRLVGELGDVSDRAKTWAADYADELKIDSLSKATREELAKPVSDALEDRGAAVLAELDDKADAFDEALATLRTQRGVATKQDAAFLRNMQARSEAFAPMAPALPAAPAAAPGRPGVLGRAREAATTALGAAETARDVGLGVPSIRDIPVFGRALGLYAQLQAGKRFLGRRGVSVPSTTTTKAAGRVNAARDRVSDAVQRLARGALKVAVTPAAKRATRATTRKLMSDVSSADPAQTAEQVQQATIGAPPAIQQAAQASAVRSLEYLQQTAPQNPLAGTPWGDSWAPAPLDGQIWQRRHAAVLDPETAVQRVLTDPGALVEAETIRATAPALWAETRDNLSRNLEALAANLPENRAISIGRAFDLPLHMSLSPGYGRLNALSAAPSQPTQQRPLSGPGPNASPLVKGDAVPR